MSTLYESKWDTAARKAYKASHPDNFAGDDLDYPIRDANDVKDAWDLARGPDQDAIRAKVKAIAKRLGLTHALPATAKDDAMEALADRPKAKIATMTVCYLEDNARSLNGRIYPKVTCDQIQASAEKKLADPNALPMTCFVSHETANSNGNVALVGRIVKVWNVGPKRMANIDIADTTVARDMLALMENKSMRSESMRVQGIKLVYSDQYDLPLVVAEDGYEPELMGIDLTTKPGLIDTARIMQVLYESAEHTPYIEAFALTDVSIEALKGAPMPIPLYLKVLANALDLQEALTDDRKAHQIVHDNLAGVLDATVGAKHGQESARFMALVEAELTEEGKAIAKKHASKIAAAHDASAHQLGMDCEGCYKEALGIALDPDQDADGIPDAEDPNDKKDDGMESHANQSLKGGNDTMTPEEMMEALKKQGFTIAPPKTKEQELQEQFDAKLAEQERKFEEKLKVLSEANPPQRQTQALNGMQESANALTPEVMYEDGDLMRGLLAPKNWKALANPRVPWPADLDPETVLHELSPFVAFGILGAQESARGRSLRDAIDAGIYS